MTVRDFYQVVSSYSTIWIHAGKDAEKYYPEEIPKHLFDRQIVYITTDFDGAITIELGD